LKRFVNFMNNPDEETAVAQFGGDDKYFGVCTLMCTMPGLPMFGHGQVEGFHEKYGMEYRRAKWDEHPNQGFVERHEREIFPLLRKRWLFSGVENFALYDFVAEGGGVDDDVFAYSNRVGGERALVLYNNKWKSTRGRVHASTHKGPLVSAIGLDPGEGDWLAFRDLSKGLEYLRPMREIVDGGFYWELEAFKYHVLSEMRGLYATKEEPYDRLAAELSGRGVPSLERALLELRFRPVHRPLCDAIARGHAEYLASAPVKEAGAAFEEKLGHVIDGLLWLLAQEDSAGRVIDRAKAMTPAKERFDAVRAWAGPATSTVPRANANANANAASANASANTTPTILAWLHVDTFLGLVAAIDPGRSRGDLAARWELALPLIDAFAAEADEWEARRRAALVLLLASLPSGSLRAIVHAALSDPRGREYLNVHQADGATWLVKERLDELTRALADREVVLGRVTNVEGTKAALEITKIAEREGFQADKIAAALAPSPPAKRNVSTAPPASRR
jgi:hypothetical protein